MEDLDDEPYRARPHRPCDGGRTREFSQRMKARAPSRSALMASSSESDGGASPHCIVSCCSPRLGNAAESISGVIFFDETIFGRRQRTVHRFPQYLTKLGIIPGIKVDTGAKPLAGFSRARPSPRGWTDCASAWSSTTSSVRASRSGARSLMTLRTASPHRSPSTPTRMLLARSRWRFASENDIRSDRRAGSP